MGGAIRAIIDKDRVVRVFGQKPGVPGLGQHNHIHSVPQCSKLRIGSRSENILAINPNHSGPQVDILLGEPLPPCFRGFHGPSFRPPVE